MRKNISRNIEDKRAKVLVKVKVIKKLLKHPVMRRLGWMRAAVGQTEEQDAQEAEL